MLEARLSQAALLKKLLDSIKELVTDANFECNEEGINLQAMDNSHVALVAVKLDADGFAKYRCDRAMPLGVNLTSLTKVLKCAKDDDRVTLKARDNADVLNLLYEAFVGDRVAEYEMKLMDIDADQLGIPETDYDVQVAMSSTEFARICRDLTNLGESVKIEVNKEGVRFTSEGDSANGSVLLIQTAESEAAYKGVLDKKKKKEEGESSGVKKEEGAEDEDETMADGEKEVEEEDEDEDAPKSAKKGKGKRISKKPADDDDDDDVIEIKDEEDAEKEKEKEDDAEHQEEEEDDAEEEDTSSKKRKKKATAKNGGPSKRAKKDKQIDEAPPGVYIEMQQAVQLTFSLKYLVNFAKSSALSNYVTLSMSNEVPLLVSYNFGSGSISYYLAPKIGDE
ncbi:proliferating cell nuclear antigen [Sistotremastrum niveocremeum HHB9708]|uniref:DNA sliding clamp PCNA n=1 Tax=Sistotremastrum niveocremeum HHB9708 TaxID=1314777 RepID=A0A164MEG8_9AGAM|nr:proliferating cell nuclear antigen [Sistotremastrum niveocremeum HHB9708]